MLLYIWSCVEQPAHNRHTMAAAKKITLDVWWTSPALEKHHAKVLDAICGEVGATWTSVPEIVPGNPTLAVGYFPRPRMHVSDSTIEVLQNVDWPHVLFVALQVAGNKTVHMSRLENTAACGDAKVALVNFIQIISDYTTQEVWADHPINKSSYVALRSWLAKAADFDAQAAGTLRRALETLRAAKKATLSADMRALVGDVARAATALL